MTDEHVPMRLIYLSMIAATTLGCASARLSNDVKPFVGHNIHELTEHLGGPTGKREGPGDLVYVWSSNDEGTMPTGTNIDGTRTGNITVHYQCTLEVTVNAQNVIESYQVEGSNAGCTALRSHLGR